MDKKPETPVQPSAREFIAGLQAMNRKQRRKFSRGHKMPMILGTNIPHHERQFTKLEIQMEGKEKP